MTRLALRKLLIACAAVLFSVSCAMFGPSIDYSKYNDDDAADNSFCYDCHVNWKKEWFVEIHRVSGVSCCDCHGDSEDHMSDEEAHVPPEVMYSKSTINASCLKKCHSKENLVKATSRHEKLFKPGNKKVCTDCHGKHRQDIRVRRWDDKTKQLIEKNGKPVDPESIDTSSPSGM